MPRPRFALPADPQSRGPARDGVRAAASSCSCRARQRGGPGRPMSRAARPGGRAASSPPAFWRRAPDWTSAASIERAAARARSCAARAARPTCGAVRLNAAADASRPFRAPVRVGARRPEGSDPLFRPAARTRVGASSWSGTSALQAGSQMPLPTRITGQTPRAASPETTSQRAVARPRRRGWRPPGPLPGASPRGWRLRPVPPDDLPEQPRKSIVRLEAPRLAAVTAAVTTRPTRGPTHGEDRPEAVRKCVLELRLWPPADCRRRDLEDRRELRLHRIVAEQVGRHSVRHAERSREGGPLLLLDQDEACAREPARRRESPTVGPLAARNRPAPWAKPTSRASSSDVVLEEAVEPLESRVDVRCQADQWSSSSSIASSSKMRLSRRSRSWLPGLPCVGFGLEHSPIAEERRVASVVAGSSPSRSRIPSIAACERYRPRNGRPRQGRPPAPGHRRPNSSSSASSRPSRYRATDRSGSGPAGPPSSSRDLAQSDPPAGASAAPAVNDLVREVVAFLRRPLGGRGTLRRGIRRRLRLRPPPVPGNPWNRRPRRRSRLWARPPGVAPRAPAARPRCCGRC
jgi:hypothetical protein